jgi:hypothetical protein
VEVTLEEPQHTGYNDASAEALKAQRQDSLFVTLNTVVSVTFEVNRKANQVNEY